MFIFFTAHHSTSHSHHHIYILIISYAIWNHTNNIIFMCFYFFPFFVFSFIFFCFFLILLWVTSHVFLFRNIFSFFLFHYNWTNMIWQHYATNNQRNPKTYKNECISMYDCMNMGKFIYICMYVHYGKNGDERIRGGKYLWQWGKMRKFLIHLLKS